MDALLQMCKRLYILELAFGLEAIKGGVGLTTMFLLFLELFTHGDEQSYISGPACKAAVTQRRHCLIIMTTSGKQSMSHLWCSTT